MRGAAGCRSVPTRATNRRHGALRMDMKLLNLPTSEHVQRYKQIARFLWKYGRSDLVQQLGIDDTLAAEDKDQPVTPTSGVAEQLVNDLEAMGPTYVKLGQLLSTRPDLLPDAYT